MPLDFSTRGSRSRCVFALGAVVACTTWPRAGRGGRAPNMCLYWAGWPRARRMFVLSGAVAYSVQVLAERDSRVLDTGLHWAG